MALNPYFPIVENVEATAGSFGETGSVGHDATAIRGKIAGSAFVCPDPCIAENITVYLWLDETNQGAIYVNCSIYNNETGAFVGETIAIEVPDYTGPDNYAWHTLWFTNGSEPTLVAGTEYMLTVWADAVNPGTVIACDMNNNLGRQYRRIIAYGAWPDPHGLAYFDNENVCIYCSYTISDAPSQSSADPTNGASGISVNKVNVSVDIADPNGDTMNWSIEVDNSDNTSANGASNSTINCSLSTPLSYSTTYTWWVNVTDGAEWTNTTYTFTTGSDPLIDINYYVKNGGDDSKSGLDDANAWENISKVNTALGDGTITVSDDIYFKRGDTWSEDLGRGKSSGLDLQLGGVEVNHMIIGAYDSGARPIITNTNSSGDISMQTSASAISCDSALGNITIENLSFVKGGDAYAQVFFTEDENYENIYVDNISISGGLHALMFWRIDGYKIENSVFVPNATGHGIGIQGHNAGTRIANGIIRNCTISDCKDGISFHFNNGETVGRVGNNHWVENVTVYNASEEPIGMAPGVGSKYYYVKDCEMYNGSYVGIVHGVSNVTLDNVYIHDQPGNGLALGKCQDIIIRNSVIENWSGTKNGLVKTEAQYAPDETHRIAIYNNNIISDGHSDHIQVNCEDVDGWFVKNNIFYSTNTTSPSLFVRILSPVNLSSMNSNWTYNMWWRGDGLTGNHWTDGNGYYNWAQWIAKPEVDNEIRDNPEFADAVGSNFTLNSSSPCIDAGDWLTQTNGGNTGTTITVDEANYFFPGISTLGVSGDSIFIGDDTNLEITAVNYTAETITVNRSITWTDAESVSLSSYSDSAPDIGAKEYSVLGNTNPTITNEVPADGVASIALQPTCNITVNDADGDTMNVTFASDCSGGWVNYQTNSSVGNGTYRWDFAGANSYSTLYNWRVYCNDGTTNISETYDFTTRWGNTAPALSAEIPTNTSVDVSLLPQLAITVTDVDGNNSNVYWYTNDSGAWYLMQTNSSVLNETVRLMSFTNASAFATTYYWRISANDTHDNTTEIYHFTTVANTNPVNSAPSPADGATDVYQTLNLQITVSDADGHTMNQTFRTNASGVWADIAWNSNTGNASLSNSTSVTSYSTKYWWSSNVSDGNGGWDNDTYSFTTSDGDGGGAGGGGGDKDNDVVDDGQPPSVIAGLEVNYVAFAVIATAVIAAIAIVLFYRKKTFPSK